MSRFAVSTTTALKHFTSNVCDRDVCGGSNLHNKAPQKECVCTENFVCLCLWMREKPEEEFIWLDANINIEKAILLTCCQTPNSHIWCCAGTFAMNCKVHLVRRPLSTNERKNHKILKSIHTSHCSKPTRVVNC